MIIKRKRNFMFLNEVDVEGEAASGDQAAEDPDYTASDEPGNDTPEESPAKGDGDNPTAEEGESSAEGGDDIDYTKGGDDDFGTDDTNDSSGTEGGGGGAPDGGEAVTADDARGMEEEIFKDLTPDQIDLKHKELKNNFLKLYNHTSNIIERVNEIPNSDNTIASINFVSAKLADLRKMVADYMNTVYSTKSYMENAINYNRFLAALNGINKILDEVNAELVNNG